MGLKTTLLSLFMLPGIVFHEMGHKIFCDIFGVKVHRVCYFSFKDPPGFVIHDPAKSFTQTFFITVGPFIFNTLLATLFAIFSVQYSLILAWLSIATAAHSFPSPGDAKSLWKETTRHITKNLLAIVGFPIALLIMGVNLLRSYWIDLVYGILFYAMVAFIL